MAEWLFEYEHDEAIWGFTVVAATQEEACARATAMGSAKLAGAIGEKIPVRAPWTPQVVGEPDVGSASLSGETK